MRRLIFVMLIAGAMVAKADNPIIQTNYTADPAPMVHDGKVYLYTTHDEDDATWFNMNDWRLYTTDDMVNWTDHGAILRYDDFSWGKSDAWAAQCIERDGLFYLYVPMITNINNRGAIGVAVADNPFGPFHDPLGQPLVQTVWGDIDPTVFIDDDGQAYLYWGNPTLYMVKLNKDMISYDGEVVKVPLNAETFGKRADESAERPAQYEEGPWLYKRNGIYYLFYPCGPLPEFLAYSTAPTAEGPWKYGDVIMTAEGGTFTVHPGVIDYEGKTYMFYHNGDLPGGGGFNRSVCVEEMEFDKDGKVKYINRTREGVNKPLRTLDPYKLVQAETMAWSDGMKAKNNAKVGNFITATKPGAYTKVASVDFGDKGAKKLAARVGTVHNGGVKLEMHLDGLEGEPVAVIDVPMTGGDDRWTIKEVELDGVKGVHDVYFVARANAPKNALFFDYWYCTE